MQEVFKMSLVRDWELPSAAREKVKMGYLIKPEHMNKETKNWTLSVGFYPGVVFGIRTYEEPDQTAYVFYIPFVDISLEIHNN